MLLSLAIFATLCLLADAVLVVPSVFGDGCVLQTNAEYGARSSIYGWANPTETVTVVLSNSASGKPIGNYSAIADASSGEWAVTLNPLREDLPAFDVTITTASGGHHVAHACVVGDVYVCSGQSK